MWVDDRNDGLTEEFFARLDEGEDTCFLSGAGLGSALDLVSSDARRVRFVVKRSSSDWDYRLVFC